MILPCASVSVPPIVAGEPKAIEPEEPIFTVRLLMVCATVANTSVPALPIPLSVMFDAILPTIAPVPVGVIAPLTVRLWPFRSKVPPLNASVPETITFEPNRTVPEVPRLTVMLPSVLPVELKFKVPTAPVPVSVKLEALLPIIEPVVEELTVPPRVRL